VIPVRMQRFRRSAAAAVLVCAVAATIVAPVVSAQEPPAYAAEAADAELTQRALVEEYLASLHEFLRWIDGVVGAMLLDAAPGEIDEYVRWRLATHHGWNHVQVEAGIAILWRESGMRPKARNPRSTAAMLPQFIASTARSLGVPHPVNDGRWAPVNEQIDGFVRYVNSAYGDSVNAWRVWRTRGWY